MWWAGSSEMGLSARAIAGSTTDHPHDPADLLRCIKFWTGSTADLQARMAGRSLQWDRLLPHWDALTQLLRHEMDTRTDRRAPRTYAEMKRVFADGIACGVCDSTGRGDVCLKCKGTGRRSGGRCRADRCYDGSDFCPTCRGEGYTINKESRDDGSH